MDNSIIGIGIALGVSFFILYTRKKKWMNEKKVWLICVGLLAFRIFGFLYSKSEFRNDKVMYFGFCVPIVYWIFDRLFKKISENIHKRDFILFLRYSDEINDGLGAKNPHVKDSDKLFSFGLLIIIVATLFIGIKIL
ncbi:hypothetical protein BWZ20_15035 [Winogradskyella sp. J14-2]|uniref:hypothetical protein n=1 Tax=Winogradskyella sp. J14-2 TaxID=1936080 RepID=UPI0009726BAE|nr:hypothetical protein [Winogradskyella sp. J14-2]APY09535.1 hypothetical protein BWZ20_15035 [Winogradskyella sp. J14-2]